MNKEVLTNKEVSDALHCLFHCARENKKIFVTQYQQFELVYNYIKQLETNWNELKQWLISNDVYYPEAILFRETLHKMRELEGGSNE